MASYKVGVVSSHPNPLCGISYHTHNLYSYLKLLTDVVLLQPTNMPLSPNYHAVHFWSPDKLVNTEVMRAVDLLHVEHEHGLKIPMESIRAASAGKPIVLTLHQVLKGANNFLGDCAVVHFPELANNKDLFYIPHGCREMSFRITKERAKQLLHMPTDRPVVVMPGRLETRKCIEELVLPRGNEDSYLGLVNDKDFYFVGAIPHTDTLEFERWVRVLKLQAPKNVHFVAGQPVPQYILDLYCQAADYLLFDNMPSHYSVSGAAQAAWEFNKVAFSPKGVLLFNELTTANSIKYYNHEHLVDALHAIDTFDSTDIQLKLAEEYMAKTFPAVAQQYHSLFSHIVEAWK